MLLQKQALKAARLYTYPSGSLPSFPRRLSKHRLIVEQMFAVYFVYYHLKLHLPVGTQSTCLVMTRDCEWKETVNFRSSEVAPDT